MGKPNQQKSYKITNKRCATNCKWTSSASRNLRLDNSQYLLIEGCDFITSKESLQANRIALIVICSLPFW